MTRLWLSLFFALWATVASAQSCGPANPNCVVPDRPAADQTNSAANTRFVQTAISSQTTHFSAGGTTTGTAANQVIATTSPPVFSLTGTPTVSFIAGFSSTGATNLNVAGTGNKAINIRSSTGLIATTTNDILAGQAYLAVYDGTVYELMTPDVQAYTTVVNQWISSIANNGVPISTQPAFTNISGSVGIAQLPADSTTWRTATTNDTILTTDCWKTVQLGTGSTGYISETLPAVAGFPTGCQVTIYNGDTASAKALSGFPADLQTLIGSSPPVYWLAPLKAATVKIINGAWATTYNPGKYVIPANLNMYVASSGHDDGTTDGLNSARPFLTGSHAYSMIKQNIDPAGKVISINLTSMTITASWNMDGPIMNASKESIVFQGNTSDATAVVLQSSTAGVSLFSTLNNAAFTVQWMTLKSSNANGACIVTGDGPLAYGNLQMDNCGNAGLDTAQPSASIHCIGPITILSTGSTNTHAVAEDGSIIFPTCAYTGSGAPAFANSFVQGDLGGKIDTAGAFSCTGCGSFTGKRYQSISTGMIVGVASETTFPGNAPGYWDQYSYFSAAGNPNISSCGTGAAFRANSTNHSGGILTGSGALTTCVINWQGSATLPAAPHCSFSTTSAVTSPTGSASTTQFTVTGGSLTSIQIDYNCGQ